MWDRPSVDHPLARGGRGVVSGLMGRESLVLAGRLEQNNQPAHLLMFALVVISLSGVGPSVGPNHNYGRDRAHGFYGGGGCVILSPLEACFAESDAVAPTRAGQKCAELQEAQLERHAPLLCCLCQPPVPVYVL